MTSFVPFIAITVPLVLTPGASTTVVLRNSVAGGIRAGIVTALGVNAGSFCYGLLTAVGLPAALQRWPIVWPVLRIGGALYLVWLGARSLWRARRAASPGAAAGTAEPSRGPWTDLYEGFLTNLLNPSIAAFYLVLLPQFVPRDAPVASRVLMLTGVHIVLALSWHLAWATAGGGLSRSLATGHRRQWLDAVTGAALIVLAIMLIR